MAFMTPVVYRGLFFKIICEPLFYHGFTLYLQILTDGEFISDGQHIQVFNSIEDAEQSQQELNEIQMLQEKIQDLVNRCLNFVPHY